jgi:hypothetical protein
MDMGNAADSWEAEPLALMEQGQSEIGDVQKTFVLHELALAYDHGRETDTKMTLGVHADPSGGFEKPAVLREILDTFDSRQMRVARELRPSDRGA